MKYKDLDSKKVIELRDYARKYKVPKYSRMRKDELISEILKRHSKSSKSSKPTKKAKTVKAPVAKLKTQKQPEKTDGVKMERLEAETRLRMKEAFSSQQAAKKYSPPEHKPVHRMPDKFATPDLPYQYNKDRVVMLVVDPKFLYAYWEVTDGNLSRVKDIAGWDSKLTLRIYDITDIDFNGHNAHSFVDNEIYERIGCWYIRLDKPQRDLIIDIGLKNSQGHFHILSRSNYAKLPPSHMAPEGPIKWMAVDDLGNYVITEIEDYTEADLFLLRRILGEDLFSRFMTGEFKGMLFSTVFKKVPNIKEISLDFPSSPTSSFFKRPDDQPRGS